MKVMLLANESPEDFSLREDKPEFDAYMGEWYAFSEEMSKAGLTQSSAALEQPSSATVVSVRDGKRKVEDGPFPDTKEQLGGFFIIDAPDLETASKWAAKCPAAKNGFVDVRPILDFEGSES